MAKATRIKTKAVAHPVPSNRDECAADIKRIGDLSRDHLRQTAEMNDAIAALTEKHQSALDAINAQIRTLQVGVHIWCEANRDELTSGGKTKTANFVTGEVQWRRKPPSCRITGAESVIETLERLGLSQFVRVKKEVNKEAILNEPKAVAGVAGVSISKDVEEFVITPFEVEPEVA